MNENETIRHTANTGAETNEPNLNHSVMKDNGTNRPTPIDPYNVVPIQTAPKKRTRKKRDPNAPKDMSMNRNPTGIGPFSAAILNTNDGDNNKILQANMRIFDLPPIKITDPPSVKARILEFFQIYAEADLKPTVAGLAMALGIDRRRLWEIKVGKEVYGVTQETTDDVKKAYQILENMWESYMNSGKINPVSGIFLGKNHFGYQDKMEYVVTPNQQSETDFSEEDMRKRYMLDGNDTVETTMDDC